MMNEPYPEWKPIFLVNSSPGEEAAYKVNDWLQRQLIEQTDPGAKVASRVEYRAMLHRLLWSDQEREV